MALGRCAYGTDEFGGNIKKVDMDQSYMTFRLEYLNQTRTGVVMNHVNE